MEKFKCSTLTWLRMPCRTGQAGNCENNIEGFTLNGKNCTRAIKTNPKVFPRFISWVAALETGLTLPILLISGPLSDKFGRKGGKLKGVKYHLESNVAIQAYYGAFSLPGCLPTASSPSSSSSTREALIFLYSAIWLQGAHNST